MIINFDEYKRNFDSHTEAWNQIIFKANTVRHNITIEAHETYRVNQLTPFSQKKGSEGNVTINAEGAVFLHSGVGTSVFTFEGTPIKRSEFRHKYFLNGGYFVGAKNSQSAIKTDDCNSSSFCPEEIINFNVGILSTISQTWSERNYFGGLSYRPLLVRNCKHAFMFLGREETWEHNGKIPDSYNTRVLGRSHARTQVKYTHVSPSLDPSVLGQVVYMNGASLYQSQLQNLTGNLVNGGGSLFHVNAQYHPHTIIMRCGFEGANEENADPSSIITYGPKHKPKEDWQISIVKTEWRGEYAS